MIAALYVDPMGVYSGLHEVDLWPVSRDARKYSGPYPVVAHPPCSRWCRLAGLVEARWGHKRGEDGGCFEAALSSVRTFGGVLEHPAFSDAFAVFGLPIPPVEGWLRAMCGGWVARVEQQRYGHLAKKATWLYAFGIGDPPSLRWGEVPDAEAPCLVSWCGNRTRSGESRPRIGKRRAAATPPEFAEELLGIARACA